MFGLFERACACALNFLTVFRNFNYYLTYNELIKTQLGHSVHNSQVVFSSLNSYPISIMFGLFERARACALKFLTDFRNFY